MGLYELMDLDLADHAIGSHVEIVKAMGAPHLAGFVNGVSVGRHNSRGWLHAKCTRFLGV